MGKEKDPIAVDLGRRGGLARAKNLSKEQLSDLGFRAISKRYPGCKRRTAVKLTKHVAVGVGQRA